MRPLSEFEIRFSTKMISLLSFSISLWVIEKSSFKGGTTYIALHLPFPFKCLQFSLNFAFSMTVNKSQRQTLQMASFHLDSQCFSHGQLYVVCSDSPVGTTVYVYFGE